MRVRSHCTRANQTAVATATVRSLHSAGDVVKNSLAPQCPAHRLPLGAQNIRLLNETSMAARADILETPNR
ncbi:uncharacterized protein MYCFIDRAFT_181247 [Pseudocercospora fijiensis CIRAD86]|uniref:Uncharacterized protein n=1 Tax=Pseudocercospora fijiensis (strain CIRAD86) TaxID=383855 RepID=N1Q749_PSEFD|nr:uncharacterized protein MYCFIDRAFT_181247 [Pseudocercospora fijiensis CIRAD86]EME88420.1 hypothetical protein MYCFIDRAFT_181247 [Pseudocercospora fijiensis CIRAD86]